MTARPHDDPAADLTRAAGWTMLALGGAAGLVLPAPVTTALWTAAARAFARAGDPRMVARLVALPKFGSRIRRGLDRRPRLIKGEGFASA